MSPARVSNPLTGSATASQSLLMNASLSENKLSSSEGANRQSVPFGSGLGAEMPTKRWGQG